MTHAQLWDFHGKYHKVSFNSTVYGSEQHIFWQHSCLLCHVSTSSRSSETSWCLVPYSDHSDLDGMCDISWGGTWSPLMGWPVHPSLGQPGSTHTSGHVTAEEGRRHLGAMPGG